MNNDDRAKFEALTDDDIAALRSMQNEYDSLLQRWGEACAGSQEVADLHATFKARERSLGKLAEQGLFKRVLSALASAQAASAEPVACRYKLSSKDKWRLADYNPTEEPQMVYDYELLSVTPAPAVAPAAVTEAEKVSGMICQPDGLKFDAFGEPRKRYVRVTLDGSHCVMRPSEGDTYVKDARESGDESPYVVADVWLSEREFDDLGEFNGF